MDAEHPTHASPDSRSFREALRDTLWSLLATLSFLLALAPLQLLTELSDWIIYPAAFATAILVGLVVRKRRFGTFGRIPRT